MEPLFVGRDKQLRQVIDLLDHAEDGAVLAVIGMHGIGKTSFLERLAALGQQRPGVVSPTPRDMATVAVRNARSDRSDGAGTSDSLSRTFDLSRMFMTRIAELTGDRRAFAEFHRVADLQNTDVKVAIAGNEMEARRSHVENVAFTTNVYFDENAVRETIRRSQMQLDRSFTDAWQAWSGKHSMLLTVDHFEAVAGTQLGDWLLDMVLKLPEMVTVLACTPAAAATFPEAGPVQLHHLEPFTREEVDDYMQRRFDPQHLDDETVGVAHRFTDGHPGGVKLVADLISERTPTKIDAVELHRVLDRLPDEPWAQWAELVELVLGSVGSDQGLKDAVRACAVANTFDEPLLADLLDAGDEGVSAVISQLHGFGLIRRLDDMEGSTTRFVLRDFIRRALVRKIRTEAQSRWEDLHRRVASHYFDQLNGMEDGTEDGCVGWYRYEQPAWQHAKAEWLYHASSLPHSRELTRARFVVVFLEAFYFWGCYQPFTFNRLLLWEWDRAGDLLDDSSPEHGTTDKNDRDLLDALTFVLDNYPPGHVKVSERWSELRQKLRLIRDLCGLGRGGRLRGPDGERALALLQVFLAHTERYQVPPGPDAEREYRTALTGFVKQKDGWMEAWLLYELADLAVAEERSDDAAALLRDSATRLGELVEEDGWDEELLANLCRASGDVLWNREEVDVAMTFYGRATLHAYRFQGVPHEPDEYTQRFYDEITSRAADRLRELAACGRKDEALAQAKLLHAIFTTTPSSDALADLDLGEPSTAELIFPSGPDDSELRSKASGFMDRWREFDEHAPDSDDDLAAVADLLQPAID